MLGVVAAILGNHTEHRYYSFLYDFAKRYYKPSSNCFRNYVLRDVYFKILKIIDK